MVPDPTPQHSPRENFPSDKDGVNASARRALDYNYNRLGDSSGVGRFRRAGDYDPDHYS